MHTNDECLAGGGESLLKTNKTKCTFCQFYGGTLKGQCHIFRGCVCNFKCTGSS